MAKNDCDRLAHAICRTVRYLVGVLQVEPSVRGDVGDVGGAGDAGDAGVVPARCWLSAQG